MIRSAMSPAEKACSTRTGRTRTWLRWVTALMILAVGFWLGMSYAVAYELTRRSRPRCVETLPESPADDWESITLSTPDGETLGAWTCPGADERPLVILLHGNGGCRSDLLPQAIWLTEQQYGVLLVSLRAHGDSTGEYNDVGYSAQQDVITAVNWLRARYPHRPVVIWGQSVGGAAAVLAADTNAAQVDGYILECVYRDLKTAVRNRLDMFLPRGLSEVAYAGLWLVSPLTAPNLSQTSPLQAGRRIPAGTPVLLLAGDADQRAKPAESQAIAERIGPHAEVTIIPHGGHLQLLAADQQAYYRAVTSLLARVPTVRPAGQ